MSKPPVRYSNLCKIPHIPFVWWSGTYSHYLKLSGTCWLFGTGGLTVFREHNGFLSEALLVFYNGNGTGKGTKGVCYMIMNKMKMRKAINPATMENHLI